MKPITRFFICALSAISLAHPARTLAQSSDDSIQTSIEYRFREEISFIAKVDSHSPAIRAAVFVRDAQSAATEVLIAEIESRDATTARARFDLRQHPLDPFTSLTYWWQVDLQDGETLQSDASTFRYEDNRFDWQSLSDQGLAIHWVDGDPSFGAKLLAALATAQASIESSLSLPRTESVTLYVYPNVSALQSALNLERSPWSGGHIVSTQDVLLIATEPSPESEALLARDLPHELTHLMLARRMGGGYAQLPSWLNEGLATLEERSPRPALRLSLEQAAREGSLLPIQSLCAAFPFDEEDALLAYAESASFVQYLRDIYGVGGIVRLLDAYQEGASCTGAVQRVYQRSLEQIEHEWMNTSLPSPSLLSQPFFYLAVAGSVGLLLGALITAFRRARHRGTRQ